MALACFVFLLAGFALLALSQKSHRKTVSRLGGGEAFTRLAPLFRPAGWLLLLAVLLLACASWGVGVGLVYYFALLTLAGFSLAMVLAVLSEHAPRS